MVSARGLQNVIAKDEHCRQHTIDANVIVFLKPIFRILKSDFRYENRLLTQETILTSVIDTRSHDDRDSIHYILEFHGTQVQASGIVDRYICGDVLIDLDASVDLETITKEIFHNTSQLWLEFPN